MMDALERQAMLAMLGRAIDGDERACAFFIEREFSMWLSATDVVGDLMELDPLTTLSNVATQAERMGIDVVDVYFEGDAVVIEREAPRRRLPEPPV